MLKHRAKLLLRKPAAALYRLLKPFIRPLAYRTRTFLLGGIPQPGQGLSAELNLRFDQAMGQAASLEAAVQNLRAEVQHLKAEMQANQLTASASVLQELQFMRDLLEEDIADARAKMEQALARHTGARAEQVLAGHMDARVEQALARHLGAKMELALARHMGDGSRAMFNRIEAYTYASARRFAVNCGNGDVLVRTEVGYIMCHGSSDPAVLAMLVESGDMEPGTRQLIERLLKPGDLFIDVGANLGLHTIAAARAMQGKGKIVAFEPFPESARLLGLSALINGFADLIEIHQAAVSTVSGKRPLYLGRVSGHHSLFPHPTALESKQRCIEVPLCRIDDVIGESESVALIKIDVEGAELEVLETARSTIHRNRDIAIIAEFGPSHLRTVGYDPADWLASFTELGMDWRVINAETGVLELYSFEQLKGVESVNLFFARTGSPLLSD